MGAPCHTLKGPLPLSRGPCCRRCPKVQLLLFGDQALGWNRDGVTSRGAGSPPWECPHSSWVHSHTTRSSPKNVGPAALWRSPGALGWGPGSRTEGAQKPRRRARILHGPICRAHLPHPPLSRWQPAQNRETREEPESHHGRGLAERRHEASSRDPESLRLGQCCCKGLHPAGGDWGGGVSLNSRWDELLR